MKRYPSKCSVYIYIFNYIYIYIFNSSSTALLPFAISLIIHGFLLLRSSQKKYYSTSGCSLQHLDIIISPWVSCPLQFFHTPFFFFSSIYDEGLMPSNQIYFFCKKKKISVWTDGLFYRQKHPPYCLQNPQNISAQCGRVCHLMKCQSSIMEKEEKDQNSFHLRNCY